MGYGANKTLSGSEWLLTLGRDVERAQATVSEKLEESAGAGQLADRLERQAGAATSPEEIARLEEEAQAARRVEQAARNEAERITRDVLEPARMALLEGERTVADDEAAGLSQRAAAQKTAFDATPSPQRLQKLLQARTKRDAALEHLRELRGEREWLPPGWVDEPDPPADADERAAALRTAFQPAKLADAKEKEAALTRKRVADDRRRWLKGLGLGVLRDPEGVWVAAGEDPEVVAEVIAELERERAELVARRKAKGAPLVGA
jgi:hypothetical protein